MAEIVGLTTGVVALASLFSTCVDLFDRFELAKDFADDYQLARTKLWVLKDRLTGWGDALNVSDPGSEDEILRRYWPEQCDSVYHSLSSIQILFGNACALAHKYDCLPGNCCSFTHLLPSTNNCSCFATSTKLGAKSRKKGWRLLRKQTSWALHAKEKFDYFIQELEFFINNLEKVKINIKETSSFLRSSRTFVGYMDKASPGTVTPTQSSFDDESYVSGSSSPTTPIRSDQGARIASNDNRLAIRTEQELLDQRVNEPCPRIGQTGMAQGTQKWGSLKLGRNSRLTQGNVGQVQSNNIQQEWGDVEDKGNSNQQQGNMSEQSFLAFHDRKKQSKSKRRSDSTNGDARDASSETNCEHSSENEAGGEHHQGA